MDLTDENRVSTDKMSYEDLLYGWRFAPVGDPRFQGETGKYWKQRMQELRDKDPEAAVAASKKIGWNP